MTNPVYLQEQVNRLARSYLKAKLVGMKSLHWFTTDNTGLEGKRYHMGIWWRHIKHKFDLPVPDHRLDRIPHDIGHSELIRFKHYGGAEIRLEAPERTDGTPVIFAVNGNSHIFAERNFGAFPDIVNDTPDNVQCGDGRGV